jgi:hypothetical protein
MTSKDLRVSEAVAKARSRTRYVRGASSNLDTTWYNKPDDLVRVPLCFIFLAEPDTS